MSTIFHAGRKVLRQEIGNHNYAEIADLLFFRVQITKYKDKEGKSFFLLPNINYLIEETGFSQRTCERALVDLEKKGFISRVKTKCYDGAVRIRIYILPKFKSIMTSISTLLKKTPENKKVVDIELDSATEASSDLANLARSIIKEEDIKRKDNINNNTHIDIETKNVRTVNFIFSFEDSRTMDLAEELEKEHLIDSLDIAYALVDLQETGLYQCQYKLIDDAISVVKRNQLGDDVLPTGDRFNSYRAIEVAEDTRDEYLTAKQQLAINQMLKFLDKKGKTLISNAKEVFSWVEFQITNPNYQFKGMGFKHCLNVIRNLLCDSSRRQYTKPIGFHPVIPKSQKPKIDISDFISNFGKAV
ncbi:hypothetical protein QIW57_08690 [Francisellaceae bacterium CB52]